MSPLHSSTRRPAPLKNTDYDHEINLVDHSTAAPAAESAAQPANEQPPSPALSDSSSRRHSDVPLRKHHTLHQLREEITRQKYGKYETRPQDNGIGAIGPETTPIEETGQPSQEDTETRGRPSSAPNRTKSVKHKEEESAIDILYENQRGGFLCGMALFSSKALGNLDPAPWTNIAQKTSATDITNAQVPDPSWEWAWKEWTVNHEDGVDEDGWEYSFAFSNKFSWHEAAWWNSYVRRRAWIRKRVKKHVGYQANEAHMLTSDYFTIHPALVRSRSVPSTRTGSVKDRYSIASHARREMAGEFVSQDIEDIGALMKALRFARIDREKTEAVENFIKNGGDDLYYLREHMHEIMGMFIFQASRRSLLTHLLKIFNEDSAALEKNKSSGESDQKSSGRGRRENLEAAVKAADEEVKKLEFWSDVKDMAEKGHTVGAVDKTKGWDETWAGLDSSAPKDVISDRKLPGTSDCEKGEEKGMVNVTGSRNGIENGKGKAKA